MAVILDDSLVGEYVSVSEIATELGVSRSTIYYHIKQGGLQTVRFEDRILIHKDVAQSWVEQYVITRNIERR